MKWYLPGKMTISVSGKKWPEGESFGVDIGLELVTEADQDYGEAFTEWGEFLKQANAALLEAPALIEQFAKDVGAEVTRVPEKPSSPGEDSAPPPREEKPPLPSAYEKSVLPTEEVRIPIPEGQKTFKVNAFVVAQTDAGDKYLQVWGDSPDWSRKWVPAWSDQAELLFGELETMDLGTIPPPYPLEATVEMGTWKNPKSGKTVPSPNKVIEWTRLE